MSPDEPDPVFEAVATLRATGVAVAPIGGDMERRQIGDLTFSHSELLPLAESRGLVEAA